MELTDLLDIVCLTVIEQLLIYQNGLSEIFGLLE